MAFFEDDDDKQEDPVANAQSGQATGAESSTLGASAPASPVSAAAEEAPKPAQGPGAQKPGNFVGIQQYLDANKKQSAKLANNVGAELENVGNQARSTLKDSEGQFNNAVDQNTVRLDQGTFNQAKTAAETLQDNQKQSFKKMRDAAYAGPASFEASDFYQPAAQSINNAVNLSNNSGTVEGQRDLISNVQKNTSPLHRVNRGALTFDSALLQADPNAKNILASARDKNIDLSGLLNTAKAQGLAKAQQGAATTAATRKAIQDEFAGDNSVQNRLKSSVEQKTKDRIAQEDARSNQLAEKIRQNALLSAEDLSYLGVSAGDYDAYKRRVADFDREWGGGAAGINAGLQDLGSSANRISAQNVASGEDYARYAALNDLMGTSNDFLTDPSKSGQINGRGVGLDLGNVLSQIDVANNIKMNERQRQQVEAEKAAARAAEERKTQQNILDQFIGGIGDTVNPAMAAIGKGLDDTVGQVGEGVAGGVGQIAQNLGNLGKKKRW